MKTLIWIPVVAALCTGCEMGSYGSRSGEYESTVVVATTSDPTVAMKNANAVMVNDLRNSKKMHDEMYLNMMISHHEGGVQLSEEALQKAKHKEIRLLAAGLINSQNREIERLQSARARWFRY